MSRPATALVPIAVFAPKSNKRSLKARSAWLCCQYIALLADKAVCSTRPGGPRTAARWQQPALVSTMAFVF